MTATIDDTDHTPHHRSAEDLAAGLDDVRRSPHDVGTLEMVTVRPGEGRRLVLDSVQLDPATGAAGDDWINRESGRTPDGSPDPTDQVTLMNSRAAELVAGRRERWALAGDQLYVDLDLSRTNLPTGTLLGIGDAVLEVTATPHTGCKQFSARFGVAALRLTATQDGRELRLRGINARVVRAGTVSTGDAIRVTRP